MKLLKGTITTDIIMLGAVNTIHLVVEAYSQVD
jgi:hypothetical protein